MLFLYNNIAVIHVLAVLASFAWILGGTRGSYLLPVIPWVTALLVEAMVCFPQHHDGETTYEARERVWHDMRSDPLVWVSLGFVLMLMIPFVNVGLCPVCDYPAIQAGADPNPIIPYIPFCVNRLEHLDTVMWFVPTLVAVVAAKHALLKRGKRRLLSLVVWNGVALGVLGALQQMTGADAPLWLEDCRQRAYFFATFGYPNMAGDYFTTLFGISVALWRWNIEEIARDGAENGISAKSGHAHRHGMSGPKKETRFWRKHYYLIPAVIFFACALDTLSRASVMLVTILAVLYFLHAFLSFFSKMKKVQRVKNGALCFFVLACIVTCSLVFMPDDLQKEVNSIDTITVLDRVTGKGQYHSRVATEIWKDHFLFGVGGWGYKHFSLQYMTDKELRNMQTFGGANVHNDHLQFLVEYGVVGVALLVAIGVLLLMPLLRIWKPLVDSVRFAPPKEQPPRPIQIFAIPAPVFCILMTSVATLVHAFGDCPMRSPAVLSLFFVSLACIDGFLPRIREERHRHHHRHR